MTCTTIWLIFLHAPIHFRSINSSYQHLLVQGEPCNFETTVIKMRANVYPIESRYITFGGVISKYVLL